METEIKPDTKPFKKLIEEIEEGEIKIPTFQRNFVWSPNDIKLLLDSIYHKYPIGSFIFWETDKPLDHHREICGRPLKETHENKKINYVLDGQQRSTSLFAAVKYGKIDDDIYIYYFDLNNQDKEEFSYKKINYEHDPEKTDSQNKKDEEEAIKKEQENLEKNSCVPLNKIFVSPNVYYEYVEKFPPEFRKKVHNLYSKFNEYPFSIITLKNEEDLKKICKIFDRINNTGKKLSIVSLMIARAWAEDFNLRLRLNKLREKLKDFGEIREITILQIAAVILNNKKSKKREIDKNLKIADIEENWEVIEKSLCDSVDYLNQKFNIPKIDYLPFDTTLVVLSYLHSKNKDLRKYDGKVREWFWKACLSNRYGSSVEGKIEKDCELFDSILDGKNTNFEYSIDWTSVKRDIINQRYHLRNAFCKTILSLFAYKKPKDFDEKGTELNLEKTFSSLNRKNLHHIFPRGYFSELLKELKKESNEEKIEKTKRQMENVESIANIMLIPFRLNRKISDDEPMKYFKELSNLENIKEILESHLIKDFESSGIPDNDFDTFINMRAELIKKELETLCSKNRLGGE